jgi:signal transduction histidine kinase
MRICIKFLIWVTVICWSFNGFTQEAPWDQKFVDSILPRLTNIKGDSNAVDQLQKLSEMYMSRNPDSTILFSDRGDSIAEKIHYYKGQVVCLMSSAMAHNIQSNWASATLKMNKAIPICQQHEPELLLQAYNVMFAISGIKGEYEKAALWKDKQLSLLKDYSGPEWVKWSLFMQMTIFYTNSKQIDSALFYADSLKVYLNKYADNSLAIKSGSYMALGNLALNSGDIERALQYFRLGPHFLGIAGIYQRLGNRDSTIFYAEKEFRTGSRLKSPNSIIPAAEILAKEYESINPSESNKYLKIYINALNNFNNTDKQLAELRLNQERLENELQSRDADNRNKLSLIVATAIVILLGGFSFLLWRNNRFKQRANQQLESSYKELKDTQAQLIQSEKMASLGELTAGIAHEIQNPLNFVNNFSEVNSELIIELKKEIDAGNIPELRSIARDLDANMQKVTLHGKRADSIVKSMLQHSKISSGVKESTDINALADECLRLSYHGIRAKEKNFNAILQTEFDSRIGNINIIPQDLGRVLLNIYNNAFHAVSERKKMELKFNPIVSVKTDGSDNGSGIRITVTDNGNGISPAVIDKIFQPFFTTKPTGEGTGLGLSLSYDIVKAHGGILKVESKEKEFTKFTIVLPH